MKAPLMIIPPSSIICKPFKGLGSKITNIFSGLKYDLEETDLKISPSEYIGATLANGFLYFLLFFVLLSILNYQQEKANPLLQGLGYSLLILTLILYTLLKYPKILAGKKAELIDKHLVFALKDLQLQVSSGVTLYNGLINVAKSEYGQASVEFEKVAKAVKTGTPLDKALEKMAVESKSEFLRRTTWQLINTIKAGSSLKEALKNLIKDLSLDQRDKIKKYTHELNLWTLIYMLFAVAVPTIGATLLVILSSFAGFGVTKAFFIFFVIMCFIIQIVLIGFVKTRRPVVNI